MKRSARIAFFPRLIQLLLILSLAVIAGGCVNLDDPEASQDFRGQVVAVVRPDQPVGQTFVARRTPLNTIQLWLRLETGEADQPGTLTAELYHAPGEAAPLVSIPLSAAAISAHYPIAIAIPKLGDPPEQSYYLRLSSTDLAVQVFGRDEDAYPRGALDQNSQPLPGDLSFRLSYEYNFQAVLQDLRRGLLDLWLILPLLLTLWLPGWLIMEGLGLAQNRDWGERVALAVGLSLATIAVLLIWLSALGISINRISVFILFGILLLALGWQVWRTRSKKVQLAASAAQHWSTWALAAIFFLSLWVRMAMVRDLAAPPWVDSVHHGMITRLILNNGHLPQTYAPFLEVEAASYHMGFHSALAIFDWLSGLDLTRAMLLFGQVLNALSIFAVYLFTTTLTENKSAGVFASLVTGFLSPMPAYLTSWGRYPQLASLLILPVAIYLVITVLEADKDEGLPVAPGRWICLFLAAALVCSGLFLTHYRVVAFMALLLIALELVRSLGFLRQGNFARATLQELSRLSLIAVLAIGLALPWLPSIFRSVYSKLSWTSVPVEAFNDFSWGFLTSAWGQYALYAAGVGILIGLVLRKRFPWIFALWLGLMVLLANPAILGLPGGGFVNNISVEISLFLPISAAAGFFPGWLFEQIQRKLPGYWQAGFIGLTSLGGLVIALFAGMALMPILNPTTFLFREADRPALSWIAQNFPGDETILINPFAWGYGLYAGNDGGYWIAPLAGHPTLPPPALYGLSNQAETILSISDLSRQAINLGTKPDDLRAFLLEQGIHYVYTGARGGAISPASLDASTGFRTLYHKNGVWFFEVVDSP